MSQLQINHNQDLKRLRDEGYNIEVRDGHLFVHHIPYVTSTKEVKTGVLVSTLNLSGCNTVKPETHVIMFSGEAPCNQNGEVIHGLTHSNATNVFSNGVSTTRTFSNKPRNGYTDYFEKVSNYATIISAPAKYLDPKQTEKPHLPIVTGHSETSFKYYDTNASRASIETINNKLSSQKIAIIGLGGTGSYVLDLVAKTPVAELHLFDGDYLLNHNAFRAPGAPSIDSLNERPFKVDYYNTVYSAMRENIFPHSCNVTESNLSELDQMDYVFICIDNNDARGQIVRHLVSKSIPFFDVGLGVNCVDDSLIGTLRVTTYDGKMKDHLDSRVPVATDPNNEYNTNIQIAELNCLNAVLAVIKWKKLSGFFQDLEQELHSTYSTNNAFLNHEDRTSVC